MASDIVLTKNEMLMTCESDNKTDDDSLDEDSHQDIFVDI